MIELSILHSGIHTSTNLA